MRLWGNIDDPTGNNKPAYANTSNITSNSSINGVAANTLYPAVYGVSKGETANTLTYEKGVQHAGWVSQKVVSGSVLRIKSTDAGNLVNIATATGFITFTNGANSAGDMATVTNANASFTITANVLSITIKNGGEYRIPPTASITNVTSNLAVTMTDRTGVRKYETLVAMKGLTGDDTKDNFWFPGS